MEGDNCVPVKEVERKRLLENVEESSKRIKLTNSSLGLSLLQAYDEDILEDYTSSDGEDTTSKKENTDSSVSSIVEVKSSESSIIKEIFGDQDEQSESIIEDNLSSYVIEEETNQTDSLNEFETSNQNCSLFASTDKMIEEHIYSEDVTCDKEVDNMTSDVVIEVLGIDKNFQKPEVTQETSVNILSCEEKTKFIERTNDKVKKEDFVEIKDVKIQKFSVQDKIHTSNDDHSIEIEKTSHNITSQPLVNVSVSKPEYFSSKSQDSAMENVKPLFEIENNPERADYNFCIFGKSEYESCGSDTDRSDSKPVKKVKLNRSKFVRSADESSVEMKFSSVKNASPLKDSPPALVKSNLDTSELTLSDSMLSSVSDVSVSQSLINLTPDSKSTVDVIEKVEENLFLCETEGSTVSKQENVNTTSPSTFSEENPSEVVTLQNNDKCLMDTVFENSEIDHPTSNMKTLFLDECITSQPADKVKAVSLEEPLIESSVNVEETVAAAIIDPVEIDEPAITDEISCHTIKNNEQAKILIEVENVNKEKVIIESANVLTCNEQLSENVTKPVNVENYVEIKNGILKENEIKEVSIKSVCDDAVRKDYEKSQLKEVVREITNVSLNDNEKLEFKDSAESGNISSEEEVFKDAMEIIENDEQSKYIVKINEETNIKVQETTEIDNTVNERNDKTIKIDKPAENIVKIKEETNISVQRIMEVDNTASEGNNRTMGVMETIENKETNNFVKIDEDMNTSVQETIEIVDIASERNEKEIGATETMENDEQPKNNVIENEEAKIIVQETTEINNIAGEEHEKMELVEEILAKDEADVTESDKTLKMTNENFHNEIETIVEENSNKIENLFEDVPEGPDVKKIDNVENNEEMEAVIEENICQEKKTEIGKKTTFLEEMEEMEEIDPLIVEKSNSSNNEANSVDKIKGETTANIESIGNREEKLNEETAIVAEEMKTEAQKIVEEKNPTNEALPKLEEGTEITVVEPIGLAKDVVEQIGSEAEAKIDDKPTDSTVSDEPSKLEQALTRRKSAHASSQTTEVSSSTSPAEESQPVVTSSETNSSKENIKLHLTVQGNRVSIKKTKSTPTEACTPEQPRVKRQYRKRAKVVPDEALLLSDEKSYKLRTRTKKGDQKDESAGEKSSNGGTQKLLQNSSNSAKKLTDNSVTVEIDRVPESKSSKVTGKVQPIKLKISKNPSVTIECTSKYSPVTIEKIGNKEKADVSEKLAGMFEEARKKDSSTSNYMEQSASAWSGPDLQRVERLLKESNITITPVMSSRDASPQPSNSILKPMLTAAKEKSTPKVTSIAPPSAPASIRPISNENTEKSSTELHQSSRNLNVIIKPLDLEEQMQCWKIARPNSSMDITPIPPVSNKHVDVKSEIRKKIASAERRKQETNDSDVEIAQETKPKAGKCLPDLLPITSVTSSSENTPQTPVTSSDESTPLMTMPETPATLDTTTTPDTLSIPVTPVTAATPGTCATSEVQTGETQTISQNSMTPVFPVIPFPVFPKKRGRPTKAMVAAREAYKQSQEAFEQFRQQSRAGMPRSQPATGENGEMSHFMVPLFDMNESPDGSPIKSKRGRKPKSDRMDRSEGADMSSLESFMMDPAREQEEIRRMEEDRIKREQERDRKNELRRLKAKERSDLVKAKRLRQKMKAEERQRRVQEQKRLLQEEKKKLEEEIKNLPTGFDPGRMKIENGGQVQNISFVMDEDSNSTIIEMGQRMKKSRMEVTDLDNKDLTVDQIAEYQWPIQGGELYMIQEQISNFLGVKSFKRKYPDIKRRPVDSEERAYLVDSGLVSETMCDLGITAVCSAEVLDIMCSDFPDKYEELRKYMREKQMKELSFKQKAWANGLGYKLLMADGSKQDLKKRAMESTSNWNSALNKSRGEDRRCAMDLQTFIVHYPKTKAQRMTIPTPKIGSFPISILPGQYCDFYKEYTSTELRYFPINTVLYGPLKHLGAANGADGSQTDSDDSSSSDESSSTTSEGTQATEDTLEDTDKDMSLDEPLQAEKSQEPGTPLKDDKEISRNELLTGMREILSEDENLKLLCKICLGDHTRNKENAAEVLITCSQCSSRSHPTCLDLSLNMVPHIKSYNWQCPDCKSCARCKENADEDKMLFCDICDRGYHIYCVGLKKVPSGSWQCQECASVENNVSQSTDTMQSGMSQEDAISVKIES